MFRILWIIFFSGFIMLQLYNSSRRKLNNSLIAFSLQTILWKGKQTENWNVFVSFAFKNWWFSNGYYVFDKGNQNESKKHKLLENIFPFTKIVFQDSLFRLNHQEVFFTENDRGIFDFIENDIFQTHPLKILKRWKKTLKSMPSDHLVRPTLRTCSFFKCEL